jgi:hypothetical protein
MALVQAPPRILSAVPSTVLVYPARLAWPRACRLPSQKAELVCVCPVDLTRPAHPRETCPLRVDGEGRGERSDYRMGRQPESEEARRVRLARVDVWLDRGKGRRLEVQARERRGRVAQNYCSKLSRYSSNEG